MPRFVRWLDKLKVADRGCHLWESYAATMGRRQVCVALLAAGLLTGCGQRGPLTLPARDVEAPAAPAAEEQVTDEEEESEEDEE